MYVGQRWFGWVGSDGSVRSSGGLLACFFVMVGRRRALVVDDDDPIRIMLAKVIERENLAVDTARDGAEAIARIDAGSYNVILLDLMMPKVDGFAVLDHLRRQDRKSTRLNSSHRCISYAVFCLKKNNRLRGDETLHDIQRSDDSGITSHESDAAANRPDDIASDVVLSVRRRLPVAFNHNAERVV